MIFTWDDTKDEINYDTHGIHLSTAAYVFNDPFRLERPDVSQITTHLRTDGRLLAK